MTTLPDFIRPVNEGETVTDAPAVEKAGWGLMAEFETPAQIMAAAKACLLYTTPSPRDPE